MEEKIRHRSNEDEQKKLLEELKKISKEELIDMIFKREKDELTIAHRQYVSTLSADEKTI